MLVLLDYFFILFHTAFVLFVLFGWAHPKTRKAHITAILLTITAWLLLGLKYGTLGYCPLTDWHWDVKRALGETGMPGSFIEYILEAVTGVDFKSRLVDMGTVLGLLLSMAMAWLKNRRSGQEEKQKQQHMA